MREFIVEFTTAIPEVAERSDVDDRRATENVRVKEFSATRHPPRLWWPGWVPQPWMDVKVTAPRPHHNDPGFSWAWGLATIRPAR